MKAALAGHFADIGHDLKTYLNPIIGFASLLLQDSSRLEEDQQNYIRLIYASAKQLLGRIDAMVELMRLYAGDVKAEHGVCYLRQIFERVEVRLGETDANRLVIQMPEELIRCRCVPSLLVGLVTELVRFRLKVNEEGTVRVGCRYDRSDASHIELFISDDGPGLADRELETARKIFSDDPGSVRPGGGSLWMVLASFYANQTGAQVLLSGGEEKFRVLVPAAQEE